MRRIAIAAIVLGLLPATTYSQGEEQQQKPTLRTDAQKREDAEIEKAYKEMIGRTKGQAQPAPVKPDPWQSVRPAASESTKR
jgi:hypothetical protein